MGVQTPGGQRNTNTNAGAGAGIAKPKVGPNTPLKSLTASGSNTLVITDDGIEIVGAATNVALQLSWNFSTTTTAADPGTGNVRFNNATPASVTEIYISSTTADAVDATTFLDSLGNTSIMYFQQSDDSTKKLIADVSAEPTDNTGWFTVTVTVADSGTLPDDAAKLLAVLEAVGGSLTASQIANVAAGSISATNVQGAINELDTEKAALAGATMTTTSVNGVTLENGGAATDFLNKAGGYTAPTDADAIHDNVAGEINAIASKATPVAADVIVIEDSADSFNKKKVAISALPGSVDSVFGRAGAVVAVAGDYTASEVTNAPAGTITATTAQAAIDELDANVNGVTLSSSGSAASVLTEAGTYVPLASNGSNVIAEFTSTVTGDITIALDDLTYFDFEIICTVASATVIDAYINTDETPANYRYISVVHSSSGASHGGADGAVVGFIDDTYSNSMRGTVRRDPTSGIVRIAARTESAPTVTDPKIQENSVTKKSSVTSITEIKFNCSAFPVGTVVRIIDPYAAAGSSFDVQEFDVTAQTITRNSTRTLALINAATIGAASTITLPTSPVEGDEVIVKDGDGGAGTDTVTISASPSSADGTLTLTANNQHRSFVYATTWRQTT